MIETLTKAQEKKVPVYLNKWLKFGLRTKTMDRKKSKAAVNFLYEEILKIEKPKYVIFLDSPMACQLAANLLKDTKFDEKIDDSQLDNQLYNQLDNQLYNQLYNQLGSQLDNQLYNQLDNQLDSQLRSQLRNQLGSQLDNQLYNQLGSQKLTVFDYPITQWWWTYIGGFYDYILHELFPEKKKDFKLYTTFLKHWPELHYYLAFKDIVFISDFPKKISRNKEFQLHKDGEAALLYRDTYGLYRLNGTNVPKDIVEIPKEKISKEMILKEDNADVRREIIRKVGIEKTIEVLGAKTTDTFKTKTGGKYELLMINYDKQGDRPYLKMQCSSSKEVFILGSAPGTKTAKEALEYLNNGYKLEETEILWEA